MNIKQISPDFSVTEQIKVGDLEQIAKAGFKTIINNRPDNESDDQPGSAELKSEAERFGIDFVEIPVVSGQFTPQNHADFDAALDYVKKPVLSFCRTGTRCSILWAAHESKSTDVDEVLLATKKAGYDLERVRPKLDAIHAACAISSEK